MITYRCVPMVTLLREGNYNNKTASDLMTGTDPSGTGRRNDDKLRRIDFSKTSLRCHVPVPEMHVLYCQLVRGASL